MKTLKQKIEIMQAALDGADIWFKTEGTNMWHEIYEPVFNWELNDYKVKPIPKVLFGFIYSTGQLSTTTCLSEEDAVEYFKNHEGRVTEFKQVIK